MARLNEPPQPQIQIVVESIDVLKRRFIRQNREITRVNSTQSLRIRNLETEISRLLAENIALREQAIAAALEAEKWRTAQNYSTSVKLVKDKLDRKLAEVNGLVQELEHVVSNEKDKRRSSGAIKWDVLARQHLTSTSPNEKDWKTRQNVSSVLGMDRDNQLQDGRLPAILEDKYYPRRTLDPLEILSLSNTADYRVEETQSPELGPPPVAHFEDTDPVKISPRRPLENDVVSQESLILPLNLKTRRKRRTSSLLQEVCDIDQEVITIAPQISDSLIISGAKRKLETSDLESPPSLLPQPAPRPTESDDFVFQRKAFPGRTSRFARPTTTQPSSDPQPKENLSSPKQSRPTRKILAPKSINSPAKRKVDSTLKPNDGKEKHVEDNFRRIAPTKVQQIRFESPKATITKVQEIRIPILENQIVNQKVADDLPPKTPAAFDVLSPISTEPSTKADQRTTNEAATVLNSVEDILNGTVGRGSRRARASVSYAEPNLRDKMRRPSKALVGAIEGLDHSRPREARRLSSIDRMENADDEHGAKVLNTDGEIKEDAMKSTMGSNEGEERWKNLPSINTKKEEPTSPLGGKDMSKKKDINQDALSSSTGVRTNRGTIGQIPQLQQKQHEEKHHEPGNRQRVNRERLSLSSSSSRYPIAS